MNPGDPKQWVRDTWCGYIYTPARVLWVTPKRVRVRLLRVARSGSRWTVESSVKRANLAGCREEDMPPELAFTEEDRKKAERRNR